MRAVRIVDGNPVVETDVAIPDPSPTQVRVKVVGAGLCGTDLHFAEEPSNGFTAGHEVAGIVDKIGEDVVGLTVGDAVAYTGSGSCGRCRNCLEGRSFACEYRTERTGFSDTPSRQFDGPMAEYFVANGDGFLPLGRLDPRIAAGVYEAGSVAMFAINSVRSKLTADRAVAVLGAGGIGLMAVQMIGALSASRIFVLDIDDKKLEAAAKFPKVTAINSNRADAAAQILAATNDRGVVATLDFAGFQATHDLAAAIIAPGGSMRFTGIAGGSTMVGQGDRAVPYNVDAMLCMGITVLDSIESFNLVERGLVTPTINYYALDDVRQAYDDLRAGRLVGRAVLVP